MEGLVDPQLFKAIEADCCNGFGFQAGGESQRPCIYLGQPFLAQPVDRNGWPSSEIDETKFLDDIHAVLRPQGIEDGDVWITDWLGRNFLTIPIARYNQIPNIINACLQCGYKFLTHGEWKAQFMPGDDFNRISFEHKLLETFEYNKQEMLKCIPNCPMDRIFNIGMRPFLKIWNYATPEGRAFCAEMRAALRKRKPVSGFNDRFNWPWFQEVAHKYGILYAGGWAKFTPYDGRGNVLGTLIPPASGGGDQQPPASADIVVPLRGEAAEGDDAQSHEPPTKRASQEQDDKTCMICMDRPASTLVLPCQHCVVCDKCSEGLERTADKSTCSYCRRPITEVFYSSGAHTVIQ